MMRSVVCVLMCVGWVSMANALTITNGDFETGGGENISNVTGWYDYNVGGFWEGAWQTNASWITPNGTNVIVLSANGSSAEDPLAGQSYLYQSIGIAAGQTSVMIGFDWGHPNDTGAGRHDKVTVSVFASDGSFVAGDNTDIYGVAGVTLLDYASFEHVRVSPAGTIDEMWSVVATLDLSDANVGDEIFLRFNSASEWPVIDNVHIVPEPMTLALLGLGGLLTRRKH